MSQKAGTVLVKVDGFVLEMMPGVKFNLGNPERTEVIANGDVSGYFVAPKPSMVSGTVPYDAKTDLEKIKNWDNVTIVVNPDAGGSYQIDKAFLSNSLEISDGGGGVPLEFKGPAAKKL